MSGAVPKTGLQTALRGVTEFKIIPWDVALQSLRQRWAAIVKDSCLNPSLLPDWQEAIATSLLDHQNMQVLVQRDDGVVTGLLPFQLIPFRLRGMPLTVLEPTTCFFAYHSELVTKGSPLKLLTGLIEHTENRKWHLLRLNGIPIDSSTASAIRKLAARPDLALVQQAGEQSPYLALRDSWEVLLARRKKRQRYEIRRRQNDFQKQRDSNIVWYRDAQEVVALLDAIMAVESHSWKAREGVAINSNPREVRYHQLLLPWLARNDALLANVLFIEGTPVAYTLACRWRGWVGILKTSYHEAYASLSVGHHSQDQLIQQVASGDTTEIDFLGDADHYKLDWASGTRLHRNYFLYRRRGRGRLVWWLRRGQAIFQRRAWSMLANSWRRGVEFIIN